MRPIELENLCLADFLCFFQKRIGNKTLLSLFQVKIYQQGKELYHQFEERRENKCISFQFFQPNPNQDSKVLAAFFLPWRRPHQINYFFQLTLPQQKIIIQNFSKHRKFQQDIDFYPQDFEDSDEDTIYTDQNSETNSLNSNEDNTQIPNTEIPSSYIQILQNWKNALESLTEDQIKIIILIIQALSNKLPLHILLQGKAGTGKSHIIQVIIFNNLMK